ncbi:uncharacterized protein LOC126691153 [Quercus robur]|uniref:uncharacterized protein LOC126691153 n=1 Tax=Quercus robur TaxID=38942 RepID=UPI0021631E2D|nr:uncharacterized protein LOC126691153 [Quercus robur]
MGIQRKSQRSLIELIESRPEKGAPEKSTQPKLPPPPPKSPLPPPQPFLPSRPDPADPKRKREQKGKDVVDAGRSRLAHEDKTQRVAKQQKTSQTLQRGMERGDNQPPKPQAWLPTPILNGEPLRDDTSLRDFNGGIGCHVASALEGALLLPNDMAELRNIRKNEVFLNLKRYLGMVEDQRQGLRKANDQLASSNEQIAALRKKLKESQKLKDQADKLKAEAEKAKVEAERARDEAEHHGYDVDVVETEDTLHVKVPAVCRTYCAQTWEEALNRVEVEASSKLRRPENIYFPPAIRASDLPSTQGEVASTVANPIEEAQPQDPLPPN